MKKIFEIIKGFEGKDVFVVKNDEKSILIIDSSEKNKAVALKFSDIFSQNEFFQKEELKEYINEGKLYLSLENESVNEKELVAKINNPIIKEIAFTSNCIAVITNDGEIILSKKLNLSLILPVNFFKLISKDSFDSMPRKMFDLVYNNKNIITDVSANKFVVGGQSIDLIHFPDLKTYFADEEKLIQIKEIIFESEKIKDKKRSRNLTLVYNNSVNGEDGRLFQNLTLKDYERLKYRIGGMKINISVNRKRVTEGEKEWVL